MEQSELATSNYPVWTNDFTLSAEWLKLKTGLDCVACVVNTEDGQIKGMSGATLVKLVVNLASGDKMKLVIKQVLGASAATSKTLGLIREALFYQSLAKDLKTKIPRSFYAYGDPATGEKFLILEDLSTYI